MDFLFYKYLSKSCANKIAKGLHLPELYDMHNVDQQCTFVNSNTTNRYIYERLLSGDPFFVGRIGGTEMTILRDYIVTTHVLGKPHIRKKLVNRLSTLSGFFPEDVVLVSKFAETTINAVKEIDLLALWWGGYESYLAEKYASNAKYTKLPLIEPWQTGVEVPWSAALEGKNVLVIHPFEESIKHQYQKRQYLFEGSNILPEFNLKTVKAVQTIAGQQDTRFDTWFDALQYMYEEAMKIDFDVAIVGCGAYGFPLSAMLKSAGKQAIHLAGATQILFGIKGKRWESEENFGYLHPWFNEHWSYPLDVDVPQGAGIVEGGCYWK